MINEKKVIERIKELEGELVRLETMRISMQGGVVELKKLLEDKK